MDADAVFTEVPSGAALTLSNGVTLDLRGATFGAEKATITPATGATATVLLTAGQEEHITATEGITLNILLTESILTGTDAYTPSVTGDATVSILAPDGEELPSWAGRIEENTFMPSSVDASRVYTWATETTTTDFHAGTYKNYVTDEPIEGNPDSNPKGWWMWTSTATIGTTANTKCFAIYSKDNGVSWTPTALTPEPSMENCITELDDGSWLMICRTVGGARKIFRSTDYKTWTAQGSLSSVAVQGSILRIGQGADGRSRYVVAHQLGPYRSNLALIFGRDVTADGEAKGVEWDAEHPVIIHSDLTGDRGYNSMCIVDENTLGIIYEVNTNSGTKDANYHKTPVTGSYIYFEQIDVSPFLK